MLSGQTGKTAGLFCQRLFVPYNHLVSEIGIWVGVLTRPLFIAGFFSGRPSSHLVTSWFSDCRRFGACPLLRFFRNAVILILIRSHQKFNKSLHGNTSTWVCMPLPKCCFPVGTPLGFRSIPEQLSVFVFPDFSWLYRTAFRANWPGGGFFCY